MRGRYYWIVISILISAAAFRIAVAHWLPNDTPDDGRVYASIARNVLEQHVYSHETQAPYDPSLIRLPGYPLFLSAIYSVFGHTNNGAVRIVQALIDTATCGLVGLLAFYWQPDEKKKYVSALAALALAAICPFTTIYAATILTEVPTNFLMMAMFVAVTLGFRELLTTEDTEEDEQKKSKRALLWWIVAGLLGGLNVLFRPDSGLFVAAAGSTLLGASIWSAAASGARRRFGSTDSDQEESDPKRRRRFALPAHSKRIGARAILWGTLFSITFASVLVPWTIRNWRVFHLFQPLSPAHGEMPGEFVPRGYSLWVRTWIDDQSYVAPFLWSLDSEPIDIDDLPPYAFDSENEKKRVATLLEAYNNPRDTEADQRPDETSSSEAPQPTPSPTAQASPARSPANAQATKPVASPDKPPVNTNTRSKTPNGNGNDNSADQSEEEDNSDQAEESNPDEKGAVEMTPEIDEGFGRLARERISRHRFKFYIWLPLKRAHTMWFDTHSQYWPFEGTLLPFEDLDYENHQQVWLPLFAGLTGLYTLLGVAGAWLLWSSGKFNARVMLLLTVLTIVFRLLLFSSLENPEPRYLVEFFPLLAVLGGMAIANIPKIAKRPQMNTDKHG